MLVLSLNVTHVCHPSGVPTFRTKVLYIPQRPSLLPLTPRDFVSAVMSFSAQKRQSHEAGFTSGGPSGAWMDRSLEVGSRFGVDPILWDRNWAELSGGEGQRVMMAIGVALGTAEVLLLDGQSLLIPIVTFPFPN
jgi:ABC-type iron transport system FetAB ATPase subunit